MSTALLRALADCYHALGLSCHGNEVPATALERQQRKAWINAGHVLAAEVHDRDDSAPTGAEAAEPITGASAGEPGALLAVLTAQARTDIPAARLECCYLGEDTYLIVSGYPGTDRDLTADRPALEHFARLLGARAVLLSRHPVEVS